MTRRGSWRRIRGRLVLSAVVVLPILSAWVLPLTVVVGAQSEPVIMATGQFVGTDSFHRGEGKALLVRLPEGQRFIRLEDFRVTNGPDLYIYLSGHPAPRDRAQLHQGAAFEVARLKGNVGNQNYPLPADLDLSKFRSVVIYCKRFSTMFAAAELTFRP